jgi:DNA replication protein DnaC
MSDPSSPETIFDWEWKHSVLPQLDRNGVESMHRHLVKEWKLPVQGEIFHECARRCSGVGSIVALVGKRGTGKTTIATQLIVRRAMNFLDAQSLVPWMPYRKLQHLNGRLKGLYGDFGCIDGESLANARDAFCRAPLMVIDEIHECEDMKLANRVLTDLIDVRYSRLKDTILISNHSAKDFQANTNDSILSRLSHHGLIIPCNWKSFRTPEGAK